MVNNRTASRRAGSSKANRTLKRPPLVEAVFELRWEIAERANLAQDPAYPLLAEVFAERITKNGYPNVHDMLPENVLAAPFSIEKRFYPAADLSSPLMQIGPGIFATNQLAGYEWTAFRKQILKGVEILLRAYPKWRGKSLTPVHLEIRYVNVIDYGTNEASNFLSFIKNATILSVEVPEPLLSILMPDSPMQARIVLSQESKRPRGSVVIIDMGSGLKEGGERIVKLENKVVSRGSSVPKLKSEAAFIASLSKWLDDAHSRLSPLFEAMFKPEIFKTFKASK